MEWIRLHPANPEVDVVDAAREKPRIPDLFGGRGPGQTKPHDRVLRVQYVHVIDGRSSFDHFFADEFEKMVALCIALTGSSEEARDLAQGSLEKAYRDWSKVSSLDQPGAWLRRVTINAANSWHRSRHRDSRLRKKISAQPERVVLAPEASEFWTLVRALPTQQRAVVALFYIEDLTVAEVGAVLGIAPGTVKATLSHARGRLAEMLAENRKAGQEHD
jgi:RNA polymerase sigma-70 factor (ECF subfamily)